jgi:hypothetical protein
MQKMIWTPRKSVLPLLVHSTMHLPLKGKKKFFFVISPDCCQYFEIQQKLGG